MPLMQSFVDIATGIGDCSSSVRILDASVRIQHNEWGNSTDSKSLSKRLGSVSVDVGDGSPGHVAKVFSEGGVIRVAWNEDDLQIIWVGSLDMFVELSQNGGESTAWWAPVKQPQQRFKKEEEEKEKESVRREHKVDARGSSSFTSEHWSRFRWPSCQRGPLRLVSHHPW